ncbi:amidohydrolase [Bartonella sp. HY038]|uniref:amidohydrolase n=1 Tax=Bartonella sp. HY038 TaxID=2759660 RepID=UPI0015F94D74|nr:amidohydrolase [Bartonella sp. HY038]
MNKEELKKKVCAAIEARRDDILALGRAIYHEPELGYKEVKTAAKVEETFKRMQLPYEKELALTGVKARLKGKNSDHSVAVIGELDAIICHEHPNADELTGAAHCCGHNVQIATMIAVGMGLQDADAMEHLSGDVVLFAVPAEEYVEIAYRNKLRQQGKIKYLGGKAELIRLGAFDDVDMAIQMHVVPDNKHERYLQLSTTSNGFIGKLITYKGQPAHAAAAPYEGVNALNAAMMGIMGVNAIRDTFKDQDNVRFHPIITKGGDLVNVVPSDVRMESYVRAANIDAMIDANKKIDRALKAGAMAIGAEVEIEDLPGYLPLNNDGNINAFFEKNAEELVGKDRVRQGKHMAGSTDTGDLSQIIPLAHPHAGGIEGTLHGKDYKIFDEDTAYIRCAQAMAMTVIDLLYGDGEGAQKVKSDFKPQLTKETYLELLESFSSN